MASNNPLQEAINQVNQQESELQEQQRILQQQREQAGSAQEDITQQISKLPKATQQALRQGGFAGLTGRENLRQVKGVEGELRGRAGEIQSYEQELDKYERETLSPVKKQIEDAKGRIAKYQEEQEAIKLALKYYQRKVPLAFVTGPAKKYLRELYDTTKQLKAHYAELEAKQNEPIVLSPVNKVADLGKVLVTPEEFAKLSPENQARAQVINPDFKIPEGNIQDIINKGVNKESEGFLAILKSNAQKDLETAGEIDISKLPKSPGKLEIAGRIFNLADFGLPRDFRQNVEFFGIDKKIAKITDSVPLGAAAFTLKNLYTSSKVAAEVEGDINKAIQLKDQADRLNKDYEQNLITDEQYNQAFDKIEANPIWNKLNDYGVIKSANELLSEQNRGDFEKTVIRAAINAPQYAQFLIPGLDVLAAAGLGAEGIRRSTDTNLPKGERLLGAGEAALAALIFGGIGKNAIQKSLSKEGPEALAASERGFVNYLESRGLNRLAKAADVGKGVLTVGGIGGLTAAEYFKEREAGATQAEALTASIAATGLGLVAPGIALSRFRLQELQKQLEGFRVKTVDTIVASPDVRRQLSLQFGRDIEKDLSVLIGRERLSQARIYISEITLNNGDKSYGIFVETGKGVRPLFSKEASEIRKATGFYYDSKGKLRRGYTIDVIGKSDDKVTKLVSNVVEQKYVEKLTGIKPIITYKETVKEPGKRESILEVIGSKEKKIGNKRVVKSLSFTQQIKPSLITKKEAKEILKAPGTQIKKGLEEGKPLVSGRSTSILTQRKGKLSVSKETSPLKIKKSFRIETRKSELGKAEEGGTFFGVKSTGKKTSLDKTFKEKEKPFKEKGDKVFKKIEQVLEKPFKKIEQNLKQKSEQRAATGTFSQIAKGAAEQGFNQKGKGLSLGKGTSSAKLKEVSEPKYFEKVKEDVGVKTNLNVNQQPRLQVKQELNIGQTNLPALNLRLEQKPALEVKTQQRQPVRLRVESRINQQPRLRPEQTRFKNPTPQKPALVRLKAPKSEIKIKEENRKSKLKGYDVLVKEKGKFVRINPKPFAKKEQALGAGFSRTKGELSQSVTVVPTSRGKPFSSTKAQAEYNKLKQAFRPSKKFGSSVQVEKNPLSQKREVDLIQAARKEADKKTFKRVGAPKIMEVR